MRGVGFRSGTAGETPAVVRYLFSNISSSANSVYGRSREIEPNLDDFNDEDLDDDLFDEDFDLSEEDAEKLGTVTEKDIDPLDDDDLDLLEDDSDELDQYDDDI